MLTAIETRYAGCRFRSRLEARWAVFFDHLGIRWEYEPQGFNVGRVSSQRRYLPDFYLRSIGLWVEVKGGEQALDIDLLIAAATPAEGSNNAGLPMDPEGTLFPDSRRNGPKLIVLGDVPRDVSLHSVICFHKGDYRRRYGLFTPGDKFELIGDREDWFATDAPERFELDGLGFTVPLPVSNPFAVPEVTDPIRAALNAARAARFEHGESG